MGGWIRNIPLRFQETSAQRPQVIERTDQSRSADERPQLRIVHARSVLYILHRCLLLKRQQAAYQTVAATGLEHSLKRSDALVRYIDEGELFIKNNHEEGGMRAIAPGRAHWLFAGSLRNRPRPRAVIRLLQSAQLNALDPQVYLREVLARLPTQTASRFEKPLPHR